MRYFSFVLGTGLACWAVASVITNGLSYGAGFCSAMAIVLVWLAYASEPKPKPYRRKFFDEQVERYGRYATEQLLEAHERALKYQYSRETVDAIEYVLDRRSEASR